MGNVAKQVQLALSNEQEIQLAYLLLSGAGIDDVDIDLLGTKPIISQFVDGRELACPQPLLKSKLALRSVQTGNYVYLVATDPNAMIDIQAYATHANIASYHWQSNDPETNKRLFHFLLQKG